MLVHPISKTFSLSIRAQASFSIHFGYGLRNAKTCLLAVADSETQNSCWVTKSLDYRMYQWRANAWIIFCACVGRILICA